MKQAERMVLRAVVKWGVWGIVLGVLLGCAAPPVPTATPAPLPTVTAPPVTLAVSATPLPTDTPASATETAQPTLTPAATITPTPSPAVPTYVQMTQGGCCVDAFFAPDATHILYLDKPTPDALTGLWAVTITTPLAAPALYTERLGPFSRDMTLNVFLENGRTIVERSSDNQRWTINNGGRHVLFAPDNSSLAWVVSEDSGNFDVRRGVIWLANVDGTNARSIATVYGGGVQAWFSDSARMLISGKRNRTDITSTLSVLTLADGSLRKLVDVERLRGLALSPDDRTLAYYVAQARDATQDGMYLLDVATPNARPQRLSFFGAYRWCSATRLLYVPLNPGAPSNELWRYDTTNGQSTPLINAAADLRFKIANGNWDVSPDGRRVLYLNARDRNLWVVTLPDTC